MIGTAIFVFSVTLALVFAVVVGKFLGRRSTVALEPSPCYRCGIIATKDFMGLHYCTMCCVVVVRMLPVVRHDPPYGFPGATGYMRFPPNETAKKKEN